MKITKFSIKHSTAVFVFLILIIVLGVGSLTRIPREMFPEVKQPLFIITTIYSGTAPKDMETLVTNKIEKKLKEIQHIDTINSSSGESYSSIMVQFDPTVTNEWAMNKVKDKIDLAKPDLPKDAETPNVRELAFDEFPVLVINLNGDFSLERLKNIAEDLKDNLESINGLLRADLIGGIEKEIKIVIDPIKLAGYHCDLNSVLGAIQMANITIPGGVVKIGNMRYKVTVPGEIDKISLLDNIIIKNMFGTIVYLRDVARVENSYKDIETISRFNSKESISLSIVKKSGANLIEVVKNVKKMVKSRQDLFPEGLNINFLFDQSNQIKEMLDDLTNNLITGVLFVIVFLFIFLGFTNSLFVASALPLSMLVGMIFFEMFGVTLNMVVLFSLVLALGMLVDNGIVVIENIFRLNSNGIPRQYAAYKGTRQVAWPIIASTATTIAAFLPLLFWNSIMGKFMKYLPMVLIVTLGASLFIALIINPVLAATFMRVKKSKKNNDDNLDLEELTKKSLTLRLYVKTMNFSLKYRFVVIIGISILLLAIMFLFGISVKSGRSNVEFFSKTTPRRAIIKIEAPIGTRLETMDKQYVKPIENILKEYEDIVYVLADVGVSTNGNNFVRGNPTPHNAKITAKFKKQGEFKKHPLEIMAELRTKIKNFDKNNNTLIGAKIYIEKENNGPPRGKPIEFSISGKDFEVIKKHINNLKSIVTKNVNGVVDLKDDYSVGSPEFKIIIDREKARLLHLNLSDIASYIRMAINGTKVSVFRKNDDEFDMTVTLSKEDKNRIEKIKNILIPVRVMTQYRIIPLKNIAKFELGQGSAVIKHRDFNKAITVTGDIFHTTSDKVMKKIKKLFKDYDIPAGYKLEYGGESKDQKKATKFLSKAFMIAIFMIILILVVQFNSILIPAVVMFSVVLSLIGVFGFILISGSSFVVIMTGIGIISLAGVVVNNAIVLIDYTKFLMDSGMEKNQAIVTAGVTRFRPVMLTAVTTVFGLMPMMLKFGIDFVNLDIKFGGESAEFWQPMANAVGYGLIFATFLTLVIVPVSFSITDSLGNKLKKIFGRNQKFIESELEKYEDIK